jgi:hypothetical protein
VRGLACARRLPGTLDGRSMRSLVHWLASREALMAICVGLVGPLLWTTLESQLAHYVHEPLSQWLFGEASAPRPAHRWFWRGNQLIYGLLSAAVFAIPLSVAFRQDRFRYGALFVATFIVSLVGGMLYAGAASDVPLLFSLPDTWALIGGSLLLFWFMNRRQKASLPSNSTPHTDARDVPAPASGSGARAGGRER